MRYGTTGTGMLRSIKPVLFLGLLVAVHGAAAQSAQGGGGVAAGAANRTRVMLTDTLRLKADSASVANRALLATLVLRLDSLIKAQEQATIGSPEAARLGHEIQVTNNQQ